MAATPTTNGSGTIAVGGQSQQVFPASVYRTRLLIQNPDTEIENLYVNLGMPGALTKSIILFPGGSYMENGPSPPSDVVTIYALTAGHAFIAKEGTGGVANATGTTDASDSIQAGGVSQQVFAINTVRTRLFIQNPETESEDLFVNLGGAASPSNSIRVPPGQSYYEGGTSPPSDSVWLYAATTGHVFIAKQG